MSTQIKGYAAQAADTPVAPFAFNRRTARADDVTIAILYCGVCHSDLHQVRNDWGNTRYPLVPGHEIIGRVTDIGGAVTRYQRGDIVGIGCMVDSCQQCTYCNSGEEQHCLKGATMTYNGVDRHDGLPTHGGYSECIVVAEKFVLRIPKELEIKAAAPLLCAGITTFSPLHRWGVAAGDRVAVVGLGGLGHMALKFAKAMGAEVTLITRTAGKEAEAGRLGADRVMISSVPASFDAARGHFDFILDTIPTQHDLNPYLSCLSVGGVLGLVGLVGFIAPPLHSAMLIGGRKSVEGSMIGGIAETQKMLDFCASHGINSDVETIPIQDINTAYERLERGNVRYRFVVDMASLNVPSN